MGGPCSMMRDIIIFSTIVFLGSWAIIALYWEVKKLKALFEDLNYLNEAGEIIYNKKTYELNNQLDRMEIWRENVQEGLRNLSQLSDKLHLKDWISLELLAKGQVPMSYCGEPTWYHRTQEKVEEVLARLAKLEIDNKVNNLTSPLTWIWMPHPAHFIGSSDCKFFLATVVGNVIISTVGEWRPQVPPIIYSAGYKDQEEFKCIGANRKYETMVFKALSAEANSCCPYEADIDHQLDFEGYNTASDAYIGHLKMCHKYASPVLGSPNE